MLYLGSKRDMDLRACESTRIGVKVKKIKIKFTDTWKNFDRENNFIIDILKKYFEIEFSDNPDYLFYSVFSDEYLNYDCIRIFFTGENFCPDFNLCDYGIGFEWLSYGDRYLRFPLFFNRSLVGTDIDAAKNKHLKAAEMAEAKSEFCSFVYSNQDADPFRQYFFEELSKYKKVNSGGRFQNNIGGAVENKLSFEEKHKFSIAFENSSHDGYGTEKLLQSFAAGTVPIYWGNPEVEKDFNGRAFINCHKFKSVQEIIEMVKELDRNRELYLQMLMEPAFNEEHTVEQAELELEKFLLHVMEQPMEQAFRRNRSYRGLELEQKLKTYVRIKKLNETYAQKGPVKWAKKLIWRS